MTAKNLQDAYRIVFNDMTNSGCNLLLGKYDAKNGSESFMHGIATVMDWIADRSGEDDFYELFTTNMIESKHRITVKRGRWKLHDDGSGTCDQCGTRQLHIWDFDNWQNFCGHCGADMRGEYEEERN